MSSYTVTGHPLGAPPIAGANGEALRALLQTVGVGATIVITLTGGEDTTIKNHGILK